MIEAQQMEKLMGYVASSTSGPNEHHLLPAMEPHKGRTTTTNIRQLKNNSTRRLPLFEYFTRLLWRRSTEHAPLAGVETHVVRFCGLLVEGHAGAFGHQLHALKNGVRPAGWDEANMHIRLEGLYWATSHTS